MLRIEVPAFEYYDERTSEFTQHKGAVLVLEHSLLSVSQWEAKWKKSFFLPEKKTHAQSIDYVRCMTINKDVNPLVYTRLKKSDFDKINAYIDDPMTATVITDNTKVPKHKNETITSEIIYWEMTEFNIPFECQKWHLNRLITLIRVCSIKNTPPKKMTNKDILAQNRALNMARRNKSRSRG